MQKSLVMMFMVLSVIFTKSAFGMDYPNVDIPKSFLTMSDAIKLVATKYAEEVSLADGCLCIEERKCCPSSKKHEKCCCSCPVILCSIKISVVGLATFISGTVCTALGYQDPEHPDPTLSLAGPILLGICGACIIGPPVIILGTNLVRKIFVNSENTYIDNQVRNLAAIPDSEGRLAEEFITLISEHLIHDGNYCKKLDAEQVLALGHRPEFKSLVDSKAFNAEALPLAIKYIQLQEMPAKDLAAIIDQRQLVDLFQKYPSFADKVRQLNPKLPVKDVNFFLLSEYQDKNITEEITNEEKYSIRIYDTIVSFSKKEWRKISKTIASFFKESTVLMDDQELQFGDDDQQKMLLTFIKMPPSEREKVRITKSNKDYLQKIDRLYGIPFLHKKFDIYYSIHGIPLNTLRGRVQFAQNNKLLITKKMLIITLKDKFSKLQFDDEDFQILSILRDPDREIFFKHFDWMSFQEAMKDEVLLKRYWDKAVSYSITQIKDKLIDFSGDPNNADVMARAWTILPDELYVIQ